MKKIIVTGGCGYIGSHTCVALIKGGFNVVIIDDLSNSDERMIGRIKEITGHAPIFEKIDLKDKKATFQIFEKHKDAQGVIHFAAYKSVGESVEKPLAYYENNIVGLLNVLTAMKSYHIKNFIFSSSCTVYGEPKTLPVTEEHPRQKPFSPYGSTKKMGEEILEDAATDDMPIILLRYFNPIGAHSSHIIGEFPSGIPNNLLPYITQTAIGKREQLQIFGDDYPSKDGTAVRDYIHVVDLAEAHLAALERLLLHKQENSLECYNLGTGLGYTVLDIVHTFEKVSGVKINYKIVGRRPGDVAITYASPEKAKKILHWSAKRNLEEMLDSAWQWELALKEQTFP